MAKLFNLAHVTTATVGTGTITLGPAVTGLLTFLQAGAVSGDIVSYAIKDGANSEIGTGAYTVSGGPTYTLTRTVTRSTNANAAISLSGSAEVFITARAEDFASRQARIVRQTNRLKYGSFLRGGDGWGVQKSSSEDTSFTVNPTATGKITSYYFNKAVAQLSCEVTGKSTFIGPIKPFLVDATKRYKFGVWASSYGPNPLPTSLEINCYNTYSQFISTLTVSINVANAESTTASLYTGIIGAAGGSSPAFPSGTVTVLPQFGYSSTTGSGLFCNAMWFIAEDEYPGNFATSLQNDGGGTHEAVSDGTNLYVLAHGLNEITKFDGNLKRVATLTVGDYPHDAVVLGTDLWTVNYDAATIQKIALSTFTVSNSYSITGSKSGFGICTDGTNLWVGAGQHAQGSAVYSVNPSTGAFTLLSTDVDTDGANIPVKHFSGSVWSVHQSNSQVKRINPSGGSTVATISCSIGDLYGLGVGGGYVFANGAKGVVQIDPATNTVVKTYLVRDLLQGVSNVEVVGDRAYACGNIGVAVIDYAAGTFEEVITDGGGAKWCRALPDGKIVVGYYAALYMHVIGVS